MTLHKLDTHMYVSQKAFVQKGNKLLVLRDPRYKVGGQVGLDFPGGKYRWGQDLHEELLREVEEETGLEIKIGEPFFVWTNYKRKSNDPDRVNVYSIGYLCKYVSGQVRLSEEHNKFEWVDKKSYKKWKENTGYFKAVEAYFKLKGT